jgi:hypothetical protein
VFHATLNNVSVILWWLVLFVEETGVPGENHRLAVTEKLLSYRFHFRIEYVLMTVFNFVCFLGNGLI